MTEDDHVYNEKSGTAIIVNAFQVQGRASKTFNPECNTYILQKNVFQNKLHCFGGTV